jgi:glucosamine--fructose-6-phosphate aminotransferase (isomerizing)
MVANSLPNYKAGIYIVEEISSQDLAWSELIHFVLEQRQAIFEIAAGIEQVIFTGCGSALNASLTAAPLFQILTGISSIALPAAETYLFPSAYINPDRRSLAIILSRSGKTTEVIRSLDYFHARKIPSIGITCTPDSPLAQSSDLSLVLTSLTERAVATTRSLTGMILTMQLLAGIIAKNEAYLEQLHHLPEIFSAKNEEFHTLGKLIGEQISIDHYAFVGNGPFYGCARESQLKIKEMTLLPADSYPMFDFRHGPKSNVDSRMLVTTFLSDTGFQQETRFVQDMCSLDGVIWVICDKADKMLRSSAQHVIELKSNLSELARIPLYLPAVQYMAYYRALGLDLNPDEPHNLSYWVEIS